MAHTGGFAILSGVCAFYYAGLLPRVLPFAGLHSTSTGDMCAIYAVVS